MTVVVRTPASSTMAASRMTRAALSSLSPSPLNRPPSPSVTLSSAGPKLCTALYVLYAVANVFQPATPMFMSERSRATLIHDWIVMTIAEPMAGMTIMTYMRLKSTSIIATGR